MPLRFTFARRVFAHFVPLRLGAPRLSTLRLSAPRLSARRRRPHLGALFMSVFGLMLIAYAIGTPSSLLLVDATAHATDGAISPIANASDSLSLTPKEIDDLDRLLGHLVTTCPGHPSLVVMPPDAAWSITRSAEDTACAASLIKLPILLAMERMEHEGRLNLSRSITLRSSDRTAGSGRLQDAPRGLAYTLSELAERMTVESDNTAANALIRFIGRDTLQAEFTTMGLKATRLEHNILASRADNPTTALELATLLATLPEGWARGYLERTENRRRLARYLPEDALLAHKTGTLRHVVHDAGVMETSAGPVIIVALVRDASSWPAAELWLGEVGRAVYLSHSRYNVAAK